MESEYKERRTKWKECYRACFCGITLTIWELWKNVLWNGEENEDECIQRMIIAKNENEGKILCIIWMEKKSAKTDRQKIVHI